MLRGMTRTIELDEALLEQVEALARREETTPAAIVERAIRHVLGEPTNAATYGDWRDHIVDGDGLTESAKSKTMHELILESYEDRG